MLSRERYSEINKPAVDELYAVATETYSDSDGNWFRVYPDGWCEQGGRIDTSGGTVTFLKPFSSTNYSITTGTYYYSASSGTPVTCYAERTPTSIFIQTRWNGGGTVFECNWEAKGYIA